MTHTFAQQIEAIQKARRLLIDIGSILNHEHPDLDATLNEAGSTISVLNMNGVTMDLALAAPKLLKALEQAYLEIQILVETEISLRGNHWPAIESDSLRATLRNTISGQLYTCWDKEEK